MEGMGVGEGRGLGQAGDSHKESFHCCLSTIICSSWHISFLWVLGTI